MSDNIGREKKFAANMEWQQTAAVAAARRQKQKHTNLAFDVHVM